MAIKRQENGDSGQMLGNKRFKIEVSERHTESHRPIAFCLVISEFDSSIVTGNRSLIYLCYDLVAKGFIDVL